MSKRNQYFDPNFIGIFTNPFYIARRGLISEIRKLSNKITGDVIDVGCGEKPYESLFKFNKYIGLEHYSTENRSAKKPDFFYDGNKFPFKNNEFDSAICNQVLEHVFNPDEFILEINRVIKKNGYLLMTVPFVWDEHEQPYDYARYSSFGVRYILEKSGFKIITIRKSVNGVGVIFQLVNAYIFKKTRFKLKIFRILAMLLLMAPINFLGIILNKILPKNDDLYLDNIILAKKVR